MYADRERDGQRLYEKERKRERRWTVLWRARSTSQKVSPAGYTLTVTAQ